MQPDTRVFHFTRIEHLPTILEHGLVSDARAQREGLLTHEIGNVGIKARRANRRVPVAPGGVVADYVPFYFAPRSPMMYAIERGNVPTYTDGCDRIVYLVSTVQRLEEAGLDLVVTDRNAVLGITAFRSLSAGVADDGFIDWDLMGARYWNNTPDEPDRVERRMAECLVIDRVPVETLIEVAGMSADVVAEAQAALDASATPLRATVRRSWYF